MLKVAVVGAGLGGLAVALGLREKGHRVTIFEQAPELGEVGAGIQMAPNASRILLEWGLGDELRRLAVRAEQTVRLRWENGAVLGSSPLGDSVEERYGAPYWHVHRADLHAILLAAVTSPDRAGEPGEVVLDARVDRVVDEEGAGVRLELDHRPSFEADVVLGADGIHSTIRDELGLVESSRFSGDMAWRAVIPSKQLRGNSRLEWILDTPAVNIWLGPGRHLVHYLVRGKEMLNIVAIVSGAVPEQESWLQEGDPKDLQKAFLRWAPEVQDLLSLVGHTTRSPLYDRLPLEFWVRGRVALLGDACHAMLPYQAQGAAQAFEDAHCLAGILADVSPDAVPDALARYEKSRIGRANAVQEASRANQTSFHLPDGPEQQTRDAAFQSLVGDSMVSFDWLWSGSNEVPRP